MTDRITVNPVMPAENMAFRRFDQAPYARGWFLSKGRIRAAAREMWRHVVALRWWDVGARLRSTFG